MERKQKRQTKDNKTKQNKQKKLPYREKEKSEIVTSPIDQINVANPPTDQPSKQASLATSQPAIHPASRQAKAPRYRRRRSRPRLQTGRHGSDEVHDVGQALVHRAEALGPVDLFAAGTLHHGRRLRRGVIPHLEHFVLFFY